MQENPDDTAKAEAAQEALRDSIERARELVSEARQVIGKEEPSPEGPPNPAS